MVQNYSNNMPCMNQGIHFSKCMKFSRTLVEFLNNYLFYQHNFTYLLTYIYFKLFVFSFYGFYSRDWNVLEWIKNNISIYLLFLIIHLSKQTKQTQKLIQNKLLLVFIMDLHVVLIHVVLDLIDKVKIQFIKLNEPEMLVFKLQIRIKINKRKVTL